MWNDGVTDNSPNRSQNKTGSFIFVWTILVSKIYTTVPTKQENVRTLGRTLLVPGLSGKGKSHPGSYSGDLVGTRTCLEPCFGRARVILIVLESVWCLCADRFFVFISNVLWLLGLKKQCVVRAPLSSEYVTVLRNWQDNLTVDNVILVP